LRYFPVFTRRLPFFWGEQRNNLHQQLKIFTKILNTWQKLLLYPDVLYIIDRYFILEYYAHNVNENKR